MTQTSEFATIDLSNAVFKEGCISFSGTKTTICLDDSFAVSVFDNGSEVVSPKMLSSSNFTVDIYTADKNDKVGCIALALGAGQGNFLLTYVNGTLEISTCLPSGTLCEIKQDDEFITRNAEIQTTIVVDSSKKKLFRFYAYARAELDVVPSTPPATHEPPVCPDAPQKLKRSKLIELADKLQEEAEEIMHPRPKRIRAMNPSRDDENEDEEEDGDDDGDDSDSDSNISSDKHSESSDEDDDGDDKDD